MRDLIGRLARGIQAPDHHVHLLIGGARLLEDGLADGLMLVARGVVRREAEGFGILLPDLPREVGASISEVGLAPRVTGM